MHISLDKKRNLYTQILGDGNKITIIGQVLSVTSGKSAKFIRFLKKYLTKNHSKLK